MYGNGKITLTNDHGTFETDAYHLEQAITKFLPASVNDMRAYMEHEIDPQGNYSDVHWVSEFLVMAAAKAPHLVVSGDRRPSWKS